MINNYPAYFYRYKQLSHPTQNSPGSQKDNKTQIMISQNTFGTVKRKMDPTKARDMFCQLFSSSTLVEYWLLCIFSHPPLLFSGRCPLPKGRLVKQPHRRSERSCGKHSSTLQAAQHQENNNTNDKYNIIQKQCFPRPPLES